MRGDLVLTPLLYSALLTACGSKPNDPFFDSGGPVNAASDVVTVTSTSGGGSSATATSTSDGAVVTSTSDSTSTGGVAGSGGSDGSTSSSVGGSSGAGGGLGEAAALTTGGTTTSSGSGGSGGNEASLLDDFEDGDVDLPALGVPPRVGRWYYYYDHDPFHEFASDPVLVDGSLVMHVSGWSSLDPASAYGGLGVDLLNAGGLPNSGMRMPYDLSAYDGIKFRGRGTGSLRVEVLTTDVERTDRGGTCTEGDACGDAHYELIDLSEAWDDYTIQFAGLVQAGWGAAFSFDKSRVLNVAFEHAGNGQYEFWVDDVMFYSD